MKIIRSLLELSNYLEQPGFAGCLADTGFLYAAAFDDDRLYQQAQNALDIITDRKIPIFVNVVSRIEFIDLIFRKQVTQGMIQLFESMSSASIHKNIWNLLKNIRDQSTAHARDGRSYKVDEARLKKLRMAFEEVSSSFKWEDFCSCYVDQKLLAEWRILEEELGLNFVEVLDGQTSEYFETPLIWSDMVRLMGKHGLRGPDAMIANLFSKSTFSLLVTNDSDFQRCFESQAVSKGNKAIFILR